MPAAFSCLPRNRDIYARDQREKREREREEPVDGATSRGGAARGWHSMEKEEKRAASEESDESEGARE